MCEFYWLKESVIEDNGKISGYTQYYFKHIPLMGISPPGNTHSTHVESDSHVHLCVNPEVGQLGGA